MKNKKILALIISASLLLTSINTSVFAQNKAFNLDKNILAESKEQSYNLENNIIQIHDLMGYTHETWQKFTTLEEGIFKIKFDEKNKKLKVFDIKSTYFSTLTHKKTYFNLKILDKNWNVKKQITFIGDDLTGWGKEEEINNFQYDYGDILSLNSLISQAINIHGKILGLPEDYPYIMPNTSSSYNFQITKEGLRAVHNPYSGNETLSSNVIDIRSEFWHLSKYMKWHVMSSNGFKIKFDENLKQLKVTDRRDDYYLNKSLKDDKYFSFLLLDKNKNEKLKLDLNGFDTGKSNKLEVINNAKFEYGDIIKIWCSSPINQSILGKVLNASADYSKGMKNISDLDGTYFEITPKGLKEIKNKSPEILGAEDITIRKGESFNNKKNVKVIDDFDGNISEKLEIIGDFDVNKIGSYTLTYKVADSNNKITQLLRKVNVVEKPKLEENKIRVGGILDKEKFSIGFDDLKKEFKIINRKNDSLNWSFFYSNYFTIKILNKNFVNKLEIALNGNDLATSEKLDKLENFKYEYGDVINISHRQPKYLKIYGNIQDNREDYSDGVQSVNNLDNVYFQITKDGLKSIYNNAPIINGVKNKIIKVGDIFNPLEGVSISDDYDTNLVPTITGNVDNKKAGNYKLTYTVRDTGGREVVATGNITVKSNEKPVLTGIDDVEIKAGTNFNDLIGVKAIDKEDGDLSNSITVKGNVDVNTPGTYKLTYLVEDSDGNALNEIRLVNVKSNNKPMLNGVNNVTIKINDAFDTLEGITAIDDEDGNLNDIIKVYGKVDTTKLGTYDLIYSVKDSDNNEIVKTRRIIVRSNETPIIEGVYNEVLKVHDPFNPLKGIIAKDKEDGDLTKNISIDGSVNIAKEGRYTLIYSVEDSDGNKSTLKRFINVKSNSKPKFTGVKDMNIPLGEEFDPYLFVTAFDKEEGDLSHRIKIKGNIDSNTIGIYELIYFVQDLDENETIEKRIITVRSNEKPKIIGSKLVTLKIGDKFDPLEGVSVTDTEDGDLKNALVIEGEVNTTMTNEYHLTYSVADSDGNENVFKRNIIVRTNDKPIILGANDIVIKVGENLDLHHGVTSHDTEDGDLTGSLVIDGKVDTYTLGEYNILYSITDSDGNKIEKARKITVKSNEKPVITGADPVTIKVLDNFNPNLGIIAADKEDGDLTSKINILGNVDTSKEGVTTLVYSVEDSDGNKETIRRRVKVRSNDKPKIIDADTLILKEGNIFEPLKGIIATDIEDGILTNNIIVTDEVDTSKVGEYKVVYSITDSDKNTTSIERKIIVQSNKKPIINGADSKIIKVGDSFNPLDNITASDFEDKDLTNKIIVTGTVDTNIKDNYKLTYSVTDSDNNNTIIERFITVRSNNTPKIFGVEDTTIKTGDNFENTSLAILAMDDEDGDLTKSVSITGTVNNNIPGEYKLIYSVTDSDGNKTTKERKVIVKSNEKPVITGANAITIKVLDSFDAKLGVTAFDKEDGDLTDKLNVLGKVDTSKEGVATLVYLVEDSDGNRSEIRRKVKVRSNDKPVLTGINTLTLKEGAKFEPLKDIIAKDAEDGLLTNKIIVTGKVDTSKVGEYKVVYSITDSDKNTTSIERKIIVQSNKKPIINGVDSKIIKIGDSFNPLEDINANDFEDKNLTNKILVTGTVDTNIKGNYKLNYSVTDSDNNTTSIERIITVRSNNRPKILGVEDTTIKAGDNFENTSLAILAMDDEDGDLTKSVSITGTVNNKVAGEYKLIYSVTDSDGNKTTKERKVTVKSNEKPVITGVDAITIKVLDNFDPNLGVRVQDKEDGDLTDKLKILGNVDTSKEDVTTLVYSVEDSDGNKETIRRRVKVRSNDKPMIIGADNLNLKEGNTFEPLKGIIATDSEDGIITNNITFTGEVDTSKEGEYILMYSITDSDKNTTSMERKIIVESNKKPVITGADNKIIKIGDTFNPLENITASDFEDKDLTNKIIVTGTVNNNVKGNYKLIYSVTDSDNNTTSIERIITVRSNSIPKIFGVEDTTIKTGDNFENTSLAILAMDDEDGDLTKSVSITGIVNNKTPGEYKLIYSVTDSDGNKTIATRKVIVKSNNKPVINGVNDYVIKVLDKFNPVTNITALDTEDGDLTEKIKIEGNVDTLTEGNYEIIYSVIDSEGNKTSENSLINVLSNEKPKLLNIEDTIIKQGDTFNAYNEGVIALDKEDGDLTGKFKVEGAVDTSIIGEYMLVYSVEDNDGNIVKANKKVTVRNNTAPVIKVPYITTIKVFESFDPMLDAIATDDEDGDLTEKIKVEGNVDTSKAGLYKLKYHIHDSDGNTSTKIREVIVKSNEKPIITVMGDLSVKIGEDLDYYYGVKATDLEDGNLNSLINTEGFIDKNLEGIYPVIYKVKDSDDNEASIKRNIIITSNEKPVINGISNVTFKIGENFNPLEGISATDKEDGDLTSNIEIESNLDMNKSGIYTLNYKVKDADNNITKATRKINIKSNEKPRILGAKDLIINQYNRFNSLIGIKAIDKEDGNLTEFIKVDEKIDTSKVGDYTLTYSVSDKDGNETTINRKITVISNEKPVISENNKVILKIGEVFKPLYGISATDKEDGDISNLLKITGTVDTKTPSVHNVNYSVIDSDGNLVSFIRKVIVRSNEKPKILGNDNIVLNSGESFNAMEGIIAKDKEDGNLTEKIVVKGDIDTSIVGIYDLNYSVIDSDGNETIATRRIEIKGLNNIKIEGIDNVEIPYGEAFDPMKGITAIDSENRDLTSSIIIEGTVHVNKPGVYKLKYIIKTQDGNEINLFRQVTVKARENNEKIITENPSVIKELITEKSKVITPLVPKKINIDSSLIETEENELNNRQNDEFNLPPIDIIKEKLTVPKETNKDEIIVKKGTDGFQVLLPQDEKPLPLWLIGIILIILGRKIRKKEED